MEDYLRGRRRWKKKKGNLHIEDEKMMLQRGEEGALAAHIQKIYTLMHGPSLASL